MKTDTQIIFFTICSKNFLSHAIALYHSLRRTHGPVQFITALCDEIEDIDLLSLPFKVIPASELGIPAWEEMLQQYNITELNTSIKPFVFTHLFHLYPGACVVYMDPDIYVLTKMKELEQAFKDGADCILTPHLLEPAEYAEMNEQKMLIYGIYNLGFCAFHDTPRVRRVLYWWGRRLEKQCVIKLSEGLFVDQKWADLLPAFIEKTTILHHPGYNIAYWNLSQRQVSLKDNGYRVNDQAVRFAHFSGRKIGDPLIFSRHSSQFNRRNIGDLNQLLIDYEKELFHCGHRYYSRFSYAYSWLGKSGKNEHTPIPDTLPTDPPGIDDSQNKIPLNATVLPYIPIELYTSLDDYINSINANQKLHTARKNYEDSLAMENPEVFLTQGYCVICGRTTDMQVGPMWSIATLPDGKPSPRWHEHLVCESCGLSSRLRASLHYFFQEIQPDPDSRIYLMEQVTPTFKKLKPIIKNLQGSEFLGDNLTPGTRQGQLRHEDAQNLSFGSNHFDCILSFEVFEHVADELKALHECYRCLKPGGTLLFTIPFRENIQKQEVRATRGQDGILHHKLPAEYHGNPLDTGGGSFCYRYFAWDILAILQKQGFTKVNAASMWSAKCKYLGEPLMIFSARKPN